MGFMGSNVIPSVATTSLIATAPSHECLCMDQLSLDFNTQKKDPTFTCLMCLALPSSLYLFSFLENNMPSTLLYLCISSIHPKDKSQFLISLHGYTYTYPITHTCFGVLGSDRIYFCEQSLLKFNKEKRKKKKEKDNNIVTSFLVVYNWRR